MTGQLISCGSNEHQTSLTRVLGKDLHKDDNPGVTGQLAAVLVCLKKVYSKYGCGTSENEVKKWEREVDKRNMGSQD